MASHQVRAAFLALFASAVLSLIDNFVGLVAEEAAVWQFQVVRAMIAIPLLLVIGRLTGQTLRPANLRNVALRSVCVSVGLLIYFAALGALSVAQAGAGLFSAPIWVLLLSALLFNVRITLVKLLAILTGFAGVLMLLQPDIEALSMLSLLPLAAGVFYGLGMLLTPFLCHDETPVALAIGIFVAMGAMSLIMLIYFSLVPTANPTFLTGGWVAPTSRFFFLTAFQALGAVIAVICIAEAYRIGTPSNVAVFEYSFLIFASIWGFMLWGVMTDALAIFGIAIILASGTFLAFRQ
ncbi:DMT family transporter [Pseudohalocynthiibacter aestuariivivens]|nr:DMT family transporter [Pseudohalocynthiibacter aestuariivivens]QIE46686.1 DMT family transporter [Pseudohalocynthiibacter aestuariivivens]